MLKTLSLPNSRELFGMILVVLFLFIQEKIPSSIATFIESPLGMILLGGSSLLFFLYGNFIIAIIFTLTVCELIRRSCNQNKQKPFYLEYTPSLTTRDISVERHRTLEEDAVSKITPMNYDFVETSFQPIADDIHYAADLVQ